MMDVNLLQPHLARFPFPTETSEKIRRLANRDLMKKERAATVRWLVNNSDDYSNNPHFGTLREDFFAILRKLFQKCGEFDVAELRLLHCYTTSSNNFINFCYEKSGTDCDPFGNVKREFGSQILQLLNESVIDHIQSARQFVLLLRTLSLLPIHVVESLDRYHKITNLFVKFNDGLTPEEKCLFLEELTYQWQTAAPVLNVELIHTLTNDLVNISDLTGVHSKIIGKICLYLSSNHEIFSEARSYSPSLHDHIFHLALKAAFFETDALIKSHIMRLINLFFEIDIIGNRSVVVWKYVTDPRIPDIMYNCEDSFKRFTMDQFHQPETIHPLADLGWSPVFLSAMSVPGDRIWPQFKCPQFISTSRRIQLLPQESGGKYAVMEKCSEWRRQCRVQEARKPSQLYVLFDEDDF